MGRLLATCFIVFTAVVLFAQPLVAKMAGLLESVAGSLSAAL